MTQERRIRVSRNTLTPDKETKLRQELAEMKRRFNTLLTQVQEMNQAFHDDMVARAEQQAATVRPRDVETIIIEVGMHEGQLILRERHTGRQVQNVQSISMSSNGNVDDLQQFDAVFIVWPEEVPRA